MTLFPLEEVPTFFMRNFGLLAEDDIKPSENPLITTMDKRGKENQQQHHIHSRI